MDHLDPQHKFGRRSLPNTIKLVALRSKNEYLLWSPWGEGQARYGLSAVKRLHVFTEGLALVAREPRSPEDDAARFPLKRGERQGLEPRVKGPRDSEDERERGERGQASAAELQGVRALLRGLWLGDDRLCAWRIGGG